MSNNLYNFRGVSFVKDYLVKYLNYIFLAEKKGQLAFVDGTKKMEFSERPHIGKYMSWTQRELPAILVGAASGNFQDMGISKGLVDAPVEGGSGNVREFGGDITVSIDISVIASTIPERDKLVDIVCIFLSHPDAKDYFYKHNLLLPKAPSMRGESDMHIPNIDYPVYKTSIGIDVVGSWRVKESSDLRLIDIIVSIEDIGD